MAAFGGKNIPIRAVIAASLTFGVIGLAYYTQKAEVITGVLTLAGIAVGFYFKRDGEVK